MNKFWRSSVEHGEDSQQYRLLDLACAKTVDLECSHHTDTHTEGDRARWGYRRQFSHVMRTCGWTN